MDVTAPWPWSDCLDFVYGEHFIEHLAIDHCLSFLLNSHKALKENGRLRISTPSLEWVLSTHFSLNSGKPNRDVEVNHALAMNRAFYGWGHKFLYSKGMLCSLFENSGFDEIKFYDYGKSDCPIYMNIERHGGYRIDNGYPSVWILECKKSKHHNNKLEQFSSIINENFMTHVRSGH